MGLRRLSRRAFWRLSAVGLGGLALGGWARLSGPAAPGPEPLWLRVPSLGLELPIVPLPATVDPLGERPAGLGWWAGSARPGQPGVAVVVAAGSQTALTALAPGTTIIVSDAPERRWLYTVVSQELVAPQDHAEHEAALGVGVERARLHLLVSDAATGRWLMVMARGTAEAGD